MATNPPSGDGHRNGMVRQRSQVLNPKTGIWTKRGPNGQFMDGKQDGHHSKALEKKSDLRMCLVDETQRGIFYLNIIYVNEGMILCRLESS